jgi:CRP/FNR family transcriptional regulator
MRAGLTESRFPFLARLGLAARRELGALVPARFRSKARLLRRGDAVQGMYFVVEGSLRVYYLTPEGREATLYRVEPGGTCVLALTSTFSEEPYPAWVDGGPESGAFVRVPPELCRRLLAAEPAFRDFVFATLSGRIFELMRTLEEAGSLQVEQRVARYLLRHAGATRSVRASQAGIAAELGTAREVVFRALRSLAARGAIVTARMRVDIVDPVALRAFADAATHG